MISCYLHKTWWAQEKSNPNFFCNFKRCKVEWPVANKMQEFTSAFWHFSPTFGGIVHVFWWWRCKWKVHLGWPAELSCRVDFYFLIEKCQSVLKSAGKNLLLDFYLSEGEIAIVQKCRKKISWEATTTNKSGK